MKNCIVLLIFLLVIPFSLFSSVTSIEVIPVGYDGQPVEANSQNNPVFHLRIYADSSGDTLTHIAVKNLMNNPYNLTPVKEPDDIVSGSVKLWYYTHNTDEFDEVSANYVTFLAVSGGDHWSNNFNLVVGNNYDLWVTVDIQPTPAINKTLEFQSDGLTFTASTVNSYDEPMPPPFLMTTDITPGNKLDVFHTDKTSSSTVPLGEQNFIPMEISFFNASGPNSADIYINAITITVKDSATGNTISPASIINYIAIQDKYYNDIYGELLPSQIPSGIVPVFIPFSNFEISVPFNTTATVRVKINLTNSASAVGKTFSLSFDNANNLSAYDSYTYKKATVSSSSFDNFPMTHNTLTIIKEPDHLNSWDNDVMPANIYKGMVNVPLIQVAFENPGDTTSASVSIKSMNVRFLNAARNAVMPKLVFSKVSLTDETGTIVFDSKVSAQLSALENIVTFSIPQGIEITGGGKITLTVKADILNNASVDSFFISTMNFPDDIKAYVAGTTKTVTINSLVPLPFESSIAVLISSFKISHTPLMPSNIFAGQKDVYLMDLNFMSPVLASGSNTITAKAITVTAFDKENNLINFSDIASNLYIKNQNFGTLQIQAPASPFAYFEFPKEITITSSGEKFSIFMDVKDGISKGSIQVMLTNTTNVYAYVNYNPSQKVYIMPQEGDSFPMSSGTGIIAGSTGSVSFTNYPNPFKIGIKTTLSYYLENDCKVSIKVYDLTGRLLKVILDNENKLKGPHNEDVWDGTDQDGRYLMAGTYLVKIDYCGKSYTRKIAFIK